MRRITLMALAAICVLASLASAQQQGSRRGGQGANPFVQQQQRQEQLRKQQEQRERSAALAATRAAGGAGAATRPTQHWIAKPGAPLAIQQWIAEQPYIRRAMIDQKASEIAAARANLDRMLKTAGEDELQRLGPVAADQLRPRRRGGLEARVEQQKSKIRSLIAQKQELEADTTPRLYTTPELEMKVGSFGPLGAVRIQQILDDNNMLVRRGRSDKLLWLTGFSTAGLVDGDRVKDTLGVRVHRHEALRHRLGQQHVPPDGAVRIHGLRAAGRRERSQPTAPSQPLASTPARRCRRICSRRGSAADLPSRSLTNAPVARDSPARSSKPSVAVQPKTKKKAHADRALSPIDVGRLV
jgi:hypothetical protein